MYINKNDKSNHGFSLVEAITSVFIFLIIFQFLFFYLRHINIENKYLYNKFIYNKNFRNVLDSVNTSVYESTKYSIHNYYLINSHLDYPATSLEKGNTLITEEYTPNSKITFVKIYFGGSVGIISYSGKKYGNIIIPDLSSQEKILDITSAKFIMKKYGVLLEGFYGKKKITKEFKK